MRIDRLDLQILRSLSRDGRKPFKEIARELDVSDATIRKRVRRMQKDEVIKQFHVLIDYDKIGNFIKAFIGLKINPPNLMEIVGNLENHPDIQVMYRTTGPWDLFVEVIVKDMQELNWFLEKKLNIGGILSTEVNIVIGPYKRCPCTNI
ncbi:Lrp/AsnC family transcriptional regulator [Candidatus Bathyarchaeota archaeon]|nr:Lrp/AsnC family transcriptional regulator [Candidatus Bathyarchaeota archaeon]